MEFISQEGCRFILERVQFHATRLIPGFTKLPHEERLRTLNLTFLKNRRHRGEAIEVFMYMHELYNVYDVQVLPCNMAAQQQNFDV